MYGKIFDTMYDGTLYGQWEAIVTFQQLIVLCDADGIVDMTPPAIAARTSIPLDIISKGLVTLADPDPYSRTPGSEGRRIELIDAHRPWGWAIVNHGKYQQLQDADTVRAQTRERVARHREKKRIETEGNAEVTEGNGVKRHTDTYTDTDTQKQEPPQAAPRAPKNQKKKAETPLPADFQISERVRAWAAEKGHSDLEARFEHFVGKARAKGYTYVDWDEGFMGAIRDDWAGFRKGTQDMASMVAGLKD